MASRESQINKIKRDFTRATNRSIKEAVQTNAAARRRVLNLMRDFEATIAGIVVNGELTAPFLNGLKVNVRGQVEELEASLIGIVADNRGKMSGLGGDVVPKALGTVPGLTGVGISSAGVSQELMVIANEFSADLIGLSRGGLSASILKKINTELSLGVLGGRSNSDVIRRISAVLGRGRRFSQEAEQIVRTDGLRIFSMANQASMERTAESIPELGKAWIWSRISRIAYAQAEEEFGEDHPIPVNEPFIVAGEALMFPRDPAGSPWNTINCACFHVPSLTNVEGVASLA